MDRITSALLAEFSKENQLGQVPEETRFEHFAAYLATSRYVADTFDTADLVTGSGGDTGIDAIAILINGALVTDSELVSELAKTNGYLDVTFVFVQAERSAAFDGAKIGTFGLGVEDFFRDSPQLPRNEAVTEAASIMSAIYALSPRFTRGNPACLLYYVTTGRWVNDAHLVARQKAVVDALTTTHLFRDVEFIDVDANNIQHLYNQTKRAISRDITFVTRTALPEIPGVDEAYLGLLPASEFMSLLQDETGILVKSIFYENVRDWQDYNPVNTEIRRTLESAQQKPRFALMNNGVTIISSTLRATGNRFHIEDYQIVNGCQTSHVLFDQRDNLDDTVLIPLRLIATRDEELIAGIVKATNRQTQVKEEQLLALNDFQKKLEAFFVTFEEGKQLFYERRSRQYNTVPGIEKTRIVTLPNLIRAYAALVLEKPHRTTRNFRALLDSVGTEIFASDHLLDPYYLAASALYRLEYLFRNYEVDAKFKVARYHILMAIRLLGSARTLPRPNSHEMARFCEKLLEVLWNPTEAAVLVRKAVDVVNDAAAGNLHRDNIRTEPFTDQVARRCREVVQKGVRA